LVVPQIRCLGDDGACVGHDYLQNLEVRICRYKANKSLIHTTKDLNWRIIFSISTIK
jgi:hypothetical protein